MARNVRSAARPAESPVIGRSQRDAASATDCAAAPDRDRPPTRAAALDGADRREIDRCTLKPLRDSNWRSSRIASAACELRCADQQRSATSSSQLIVSRSPTTCASSHVAANRRASMLCDRAWRADRRRQCRDRSRSSRSIVRASIGRSSATRAAPMLVATPPIALGESPWRSLTGIAQTVDMLAIAASNLTVERCCVDAAAPTRRWPRLIGEIERWRSDRCVIALLTARDADAVENGGSSAWRDADAMALELSDARRSSTMARQRRAADRAPIGSVGAQSRRSDAPSRPHRLRTVAIACRPTCATCARSRQRHRA